MKGARIKSEKQLYQWDVNQYLIELQPTAEFVDYPVGNEVIRLETDGTRCRIPDEVLQTYGGKTCYERYPDGTYRAYSFTVLYAPKPPDYVYTTEEHTTFEALTARVDAAIEEIKRRADSGEFTPVKGVDYFTDAEKTELMEGVSSGAVGEFRKVVDTATAEYNDNHNLQLAKYNANASEKLTTYDVNAEQRTTDYNRNAAEKLEAYNSNHAEKVAEYNQNAAALQTEVDRLRGECDNLAEENRKQENRISALMKLNKGQTYDILPEDGESASRTAPSGSKYVSVDRLGGKSIVWNQLNNPADNINVKKGAIQLNDDGSITISGTVQDAGKYNELQISQILTFDVANGTDVNIERLLVQVINLSLAFGAGNEPTAEQFTAMFPAESYPYNPGQIISSRTATIAAGAESVTTGFPELRSALAAHDYIDMNGEKVHRKIKTTRIDGNTPIYSVRTDQDNCCRVVFTPETSPEIVISEEPTIPTNIISDKLATITHNNYWSADAYTGIEAYPGYASISMRLQDRTDLDTKEKVSAWLADNPTTVYYETESDELTDVTIPEALTEWLPVEAGGTVTFRNEDESKQLAVPNAVSWVRKLNEVE